MLSRLAQEFADEIANHDWSDAPYRLDRAGHSREHDSYSTTKVLSDRETDAVRTNVMWVAAQVLLHADPNLDPHEFAAACGVSADHPQQRRSQERRDHGGLRRSNGKAAPPGRWS